MKKFTFGVSGFSLQVFLFFCFEVSKAFLSDAIIKPFLSKKKKCDVKLGFLLCPFWGKTGILSPLFEAAFLDTCLILSLNLSYYIPFYRQFPFSLLSLNLSFSHSFSLALFLLVSLSFRHYWSLWSIYSAFFRHFYFLFLLSSSLTQFILALFLLSLPTSLSWRIHPDTNSQLSKKILDFSHSSLFLLFVFNLWSFDMSTPSKG